MMRKRRPSLLPVCNPVRNLFLSFPAAAKEYIRNLFCVVAGFSRQPEQEPKALRCDWMGALGRAGDLVGASRPWLCAPSPLRTPFERWKRGGQKQPAHFPSSHCARLHLHFSLYISIRLLFSSAASLTDRTLELKGALQVSDMRIVRSMLFLPRHHQQCNALISSSLSDGFTPHL